MSADTPSRPLPLVQVERPTADRGADDARQHLDSLGECVFSGEPVPPNESKITLDKFGTAVRRNLSKAHLDHSDGWKQAVHQQHHAEDMRFCPSCGDVTTETTQEECSSCDPPEWRRESGRKR